MILLFAKILQGFGKMIISFLSQSRTWLAHVHDQYKNLDRKKIAGWHDISNVLALTDYLTTTKNEFRVIVSCQRTGTLDTFKELLRTGIQVLRLKKQLISKRNRRTQPVDYSEIGEKQAREIKSLDIVLRTQAN